jgi:hypothetical protein
VFIVKMSRLVMGSAVAASLVGAGLFATPVGAQDECGVSVYGGDVWNETVIDISANAGTSISDSSAGSNNLATTNGGGGGEGGVFNTASAGNGGVATSAANGGAISTGDINSGGNAGNAISVGNTYCDVAPYEEPVYEEAVYEEPVYEEVVALPDTGVGAGEINGIFAVLASAGAAAASFGLRRR